MQTQDAIQQAIEAMKGMNQDARNTLVTVVMAIVTNSRDVVETLHQNAPNDLAAALSAVLNSMNPPKSATVDCSQEVIEPSLPDAMAILDLVINAPDHEVLDESSKKTALLLAWEILTKAGVK